MKTKDKINYMADEGKVFIRKSDNLIMGHSLGLGSEDNINNYIEIDCPIEYKEIKGYDNMLKEKNEEQEIDIIDFPSHRIVS